jgi:hypothetical protein
MVTILLQLAVDLISLGAGRDCVETGGERKPDGESEKTNKQNEQTADPRISYFLVLDTTNPDQWPQHANKQRCH